jgi:hypothetical protein
MPDSGPTMIGCPACAGALRAEVGPHRHIEFICSVGHAFSLADLYQAKEEELEQSEWSVMALLRHLEMILGMALDRGSESETRDVQAIHRRLEQVNRQITIIEQMIQHTQVVTQQTPATAGDAFPGTAHE